MSSLSSSENTSSQQEISTQASPIVGDTSSGLRMSDASVLTILNQLEPSSMPHSSLLETWKIDTELLQQIQNWNDDHPEKKLSHIVKDICDRIRPDSVFLELIPDTLCAVPIRGLVKSSMAFCKLAAAFVWAKDDTATFMQEIFEWLEGLTCPSDSENKAWKCLDDMEKLIKDACQWASKLLRAKYAIIKRLSVQSKIQYYREEFTKTLGKYTVIRSMQGVLGVETIAKEVHTIAENDETARRADFLKKRLLRIIQNSSYDLQEKRHCEPGTREEILNEIKWWIHDFSEDSKHFYWLSGPPGVGKSAITASVVRDCMDRYILGAQFFVNRNDATTTDPRALFHTICWQLCDRFPSVAIAMKETLRVQPTVVDDISDDQVTKLFVNAINTAAVSDPFKAVVVIIDALDEIHTEHLRHLARVLSKVAADLSPNAKIFISSRTEEAITNSFNPLDGRKQVKSRHLTTKESIKEVSEFMEKKVKEILNDYSMDWANWGDDRMKKLSSQASGLYIWAETALKYLRAEIENVGVAFFGGPLDILTDNGTGGINTLYLNILEKKCKPVNGTGDWEYQRFRRIIGAILIRQTPLSIIDIGQLLKLQEPRYSNPVDLVHFVRQYRTVLVNDTKVIDESVVPRMHKSFAEFVTSEHAQKFRVYENESHGEMALRCIDQLHDLIPYLMRVTPRSFPTNLLYVSQHWQSHLTRIVEPETRMPVNDAEETNEYNILKGNDNLNDLKALLLGQTDPLARISFAFSQDGTQIASSHVEGTIRIWNTETGLEAMYLTTTGRNDRVRSIEFSLDGRQLVASSGTTASIWDTRTGSLLHMLHGHTRMVTHVGYSHDGRTVVTCSVDGTVRTWDSSTGQPCKVFELFNGHRWTIIYCIFSRNDQRIASYSEFNKITVWDVNSGNIISYFDCYGCETILFCPCGDHLMSCDYDPIVTTILWDTQSGKQLDCANSTVEPLAFKFAEDSEQRYIEVPQVVKHANQNPHLYALSLCLGPTGKKGTVLGIVENGKGSWGLLMPLADGLKIAKIYFDMGATRMNDESRKAY